MVIGIPTILLAALSPDRHCTYFPDTLHMTLLPAFQSVFFFAVCPVRFRIWHCIAHHQHLL
jgi:hypothetical protein